MRSLIINLLLSCIYLFPAHVCDTHSAKEGKLKMFAQKEEVALFNSEGKAIAYIAADGTTIFLWNGKPVAYLASNRLDDTFNIYGFNGKHLGWFVKGILRDHDGNMTGFVKGTINMYTEFEPYKGYKEYVPYKAYKEYAPNMPYLSNNFSNVTLSSFLAQGVD